MMEVPYPDRARLRAELERLCQQRRWLEVWDRVEELDEAELVAEPGVAFLAGEALVHLGRVQRALNLVLAAESEFRARQDPVNLMAALNLAGAVQFELGDLESAEDRFSELLELAREREDEQMSGRATNNLGAIASLRGDHDRALSLYRLAIPVYQRVGFLAGLAQTHHNLGIVSRDLGRWDEAQQNYEAAQRHARELGDARLAAMARVGAAEIAFWRADARYAGAEAEHALESFRDQGDELGRADALRLLGVVAAAQGDGSLAKRRLEEALELAREHGNPLLEAEILEERSELRAGAGQLALARADLQVAAALYRRLGAVKRQAGAEERLSALGR